MIRFFIWLLMEFPADYRATKRGCGAILKRKARKAAYRGIRRLLR